MDTDEFTLGKRKLKKTTWIHAVTRCSLLMHLRIARSYCFVLFWRYHKPQVRDLMSGKREIFISVDSNRLKHTRWDDLIFEGHCLLLGVRKQKRETHIGKWNSWSEWKDPEDITSPSLFLVPAAATKAKYWMTFLVFSVLPAPDSPVINIDWFSRSKHTVGSDLCNACCNHFILALIRFDDASSSVPYRFHLVYRQRLLICTSFSFLISRDRQM